MLTTGMEIALHLELWMAADGEISLSHMRGLSDEAACMMAYFPELDSIEAESIAMLLFYAPEENRLAPGDAVPLVLGDTDFALHFLRCNEDQTYWEEYVMVMQDDIEIEVEEVYFEFEEPVAIFSAFDDFAKMEMAWFAAG